MKTMTHMVDYKMKKFLKACKKDRYLKKYPKIKQTIDWYITRIKQVEQEVLANPIVLPDEVYSRKITLREGGYAHYYWEFYEEGKESYALIRWDINKLKEMAKSVEKQKFGPFHFTNSFGETFDETKLDASKLDDALKNDEPVISLYDDYTNEYFVIGEGEYRVFARYKEMLKIKEVEDYLIWRCSFGIGLERKYDLEKFAIEGWELPVEMHLDAMVSDLDRTLYKVICNIRFLYTYYAEDLKRTMNFKLEDFERNLFEV